MTGPEGDWRDAADRGVSALPVVEDLDVARLPHAPRDGPYTDPLRRGITAAAWTFFAAHPLQKRCAPR